MPALQHTARTAQRRGRSGSFVAVPADEGAAGSAPYGGLPVQELPPDPGTVLRRLRAAYPAWGILHDAAASRWIAVRGREVTLVRATAIELRSAIDASIRH
jgi:hypothetical protein